jgi:hypothetical protein
MTIPAEQNPASIYPEDILDHGPNGKPWQVAHVKSRREKALAFFLASSGIGYYLPMYKRRQASQKRVRYSLVPLFSGYLFFRGDDFDRLMVLRSNHAARIIEVRTPEKLILELQDIHKALTADCQAYPYDFVTEGQRVRVKKGPLKDVEGIIMRKEKHFRLVLTVSILMQSVAITIDADMVEPVS